MKSPVTTTRNITNIGVANNIISAPIPINQYGNCDDPQASALKHTTPTITKEQGPPNPNNRHNKILAVVLTK